MDLKFYKLSGSPGRCAIAAYNPVEVMGIAAIIFKCDHNKLVDSQIWESLIFSKERLYEYTRGKTGYFTGIMENKTSDKWKFYPLNVRRYYINIALKAL